MSTSVIKNSVISINKTSKNILNKTNIGNIKSILLKVGFMVRKALFTAVITELSISAFGKSENTLTKIVSTRSNIYLFVTTK